MLKALAHSRKVMAILLMRQHTVRGGDHQEEEPRPKRTENAEGACSRSQCCSLAGSCYWGALGDREQKALFLESSSGMGSQGVDTSENYRLLPPRGQTPCVRRVALGAQRNCHPNGFSSKRAGAYVLALTSKPYAAGLRHVKVKVRYHALREYKEAPLASSQSGHFENAYIVYAWCVDFMHLSHPYSEPCGLLSFCTRSLLTRLSQMLLLRISVSLHPVLCFSYQQLLNSLHGLTHVQTTFISSLLRRAHRYLLSYLVPGCCAACPMNGSQPGLFFTGRYQWGDRLCEAHARRVNGL
jgi:hypothetical protein